jgi:dihydrofolate synthase/folylpolyglutamate synthase
MNLEAWLALLEKRHPQAIELGLERCGEVYRALGGPRPARQVFTVAGTNGKGSTVAFIAALCGAAGLRHGTYTSPHIFRFNERVSIMGQSVMDADLVHAFERVEAARGGVSLTYFEFTTLAALLLLQQADLDCAVLEVGLGGRLDAVNLVNADCTVITPIGLDHQDYLGPDIDSIAAEKAGIMRTGVPVICTEMEPPVPVTDTAQRLQAPVLLRGRDYELTEQGGRLRYFQAGVGLELPRPAMPGRYQLDNLAAALCAFFTLNPDASENPAPLAAAVAEVRVPGRLQRAVEAPLILLDVGHNTLAAEAVAHWLGNEREKGAISDVTCVLAMLVDKPAEDVARTLQPVCDRWLCAGSTGARGQTGEALAGRVSAALGGGDVQAASVVESAMQRAVAMAGDTGCVLVFGSFVTVEAAAAWIGQHMQRGPHDTAKIL